MTAPERFRQKVRVDSTGCHVWTGARSRKGYGRFADGRVFFAHRWIWEHESGPVPDGYQVHHRCERKDCVNAGHLELVSTTEHAAIHGKTFAAADREKGQAVNRDKTCCPRGHPYAGDNLYTYTTSSGGIGRDCRECRKRRTREYRARKAVA